jgi:hypothetical protein
MVKEADPRFFREVKPVWRTPKINLSVHFILSMPIPLEGEEGKRHRGRFYGFMILDARIRGSRFLLTS